MASRGAGSRRKGAAYEVAIAKILSQRFGVEVKRTGAQESAKVHGGDVNAAKYQNTILNDFFFELKCRESWSILDWYKKACDDRGGFMQKVALVMTKNHEKDYVFLSLEDFIQILLELDGYRKEEAQA